MNNLAPEILLREEFDNNRGQLTQYDTPDTTQRSALLDRSHVDIRIFDQESKLAPLSIVVGDQYTMSILDQYTITDLEGELVYKRGEQWTAGQCMHNPDRNNLRELQLPCVGGTTTTTQSVISQQTDLDPTNTELETIDLSTGFIDSDMISIALPAFPLDSLDLSQSGVDFTSAIDGDFDAGPTASINIQQFALLLALSNMALTHLVDGQANEMRFPRGDLDAPGLDLTQITGVRFRFTAANTCLVRIAACRLLSASWEYAPYDLNTQSGNWEPSTSKTGSLLEPYQFPNSSSWPTLWRANDPPNQVDPRPIDGQFSIDLHSGAMINATGVPNYGISLQSGNIAVTNPPSLTGPLTLEAWINPTSLDSSQFNWQGGLDEIAVYDTALSAAQLKRHYITGRAIWGNYRPVVMSDNPVGFWRLNEIGGFALDESGNNHAGTYTGQAKFRQQGALNLDVFNQVSLFLREFPLDSVIQLDLNSSGTASTSQAQLEGLGAQPNYGPADFLPREQRDLDILTQSSMDAQMQGQLERIKDTVTEDWIEIRFQWSLHNSILTITNRPQDLIYEFPGLVVRPEHDYIVLADLEDNSLRVQIYELDKQGLVRFDAPVIDTTEIIDASLIRRRRGRVGWFTDLIDGDSNVHNIRTKGLSFGEVESAQFESITPVTGAALFAGSTPNRELFQGFDPGPFGGVIEPDTTKSSSGRSFKITNLGQAPLQGIQTTPTYFDEWAEIGITFDLWIPQDMLTKREFLTGYLLGEQGRLVQLNLGAIQAGQWHSVTIKLDELGSFQTGYYRLILLQSMLASPLAWYIDNMSIQQRVVAWYGRARDDYWYGAWQDLHNTVNSIGGMLFRHEGTNLQFKGKALHHNAQISDIKTLPRYAESSRFFWTDQQVIYRDPPIALIDLNINGPVVVFSGENSYCPGPGHIISWVWTFGDGNEDAGPIVTYTYAGLGSFSATLTVTDDQGNQSQALATVVIEEVIPVGIDWTAHSFLQLTAKTVGATVSGQLACVGRASTTFAATKGSIVTGGCSWHHGSKCHVVPCSLQRQFFAGFAIGSFSEFVSIDIDAGQLAISTTETFSGNHSGRATYYGGKVNGHARGYFNPLWNQGNQIKYRAAFYLPVGFFNALQGQCPVIRWDNSPTFPLRPDQGGIYLHPGGTASLSYIDAVIGQTDILTFTLTEGRWNFIEVHQTLGNSSFASNEVFLNGLSVGHSSAANSARYPITRCHYGIVDIDIRLQSNSLFLFFDVCEILSGC